MLTSFFTLGLLLTIALAAPSPRYVQHEKRNTLPRGWEKLQRIPGHEVLPIRIALTQGNLDKADGYLMDVSHPESPNFGKHWSAKQVAETFAPSQESVEIVTDWLRSSGISSERISKPQSMGWLTFDATVAEAENLLKTKFHLHKHETGKPHIGCDKYYVPENLKPHVDFITPTVHFDTKIPHAAIEKREASMTAAAGVPVRTKAALDVTKPTNGFQPKKGEDVSVQGLINELNNCNKYITPDCLRALYEFPPGFSSNPQNSYGVVEYSPQTYIQGDLDLFFANFSQNQVQKYPVFDSIDGGVLQYVNESFIYNSEADLDLEYAMTLVNPQKVTLYQAGDLVEGASFNSFLDALDGSYCTGDDPLQDPAYPDRFVGGYTGPETCGGFAATKVISTSFGYNEADLTPAYEKRQCNEYLKIGLQGTSFVFSSGDYGVAGNYGQCIGNNGTFNNGTSGQFNPSFPSTCPYITSVGATQIVPGNSVFQPEEVCETVIFSGGGFSNVFDMPSYQKAAVEDYFANHLPPYNSTQYNNSQMSRGFPDISANGANYVVAVDGVFSLLYGTSASAPVVGSILTLINEVRFDIGKGSIGFINPTLLSLRRAAFRLLSSPPTASISTKSRTLTSLTSSVHRLPSKQPSIFPVQRRFASEEAITQSEPEADGATEAQHGEDSVAAASESADARSSADQDDHATVTSAVESAAGTVTDQASAAAERVSNAAQTAGQSVASSADAAGQTLSQAAGMPNDDMESLYSDTSKTVYIGNLFFDVRSEDLQKEFSRAGEVVSSKIIMDQRGLSKGFGYIEFTTVEAAGKAIDLFNLQNFEGRRLSVQYSLSRRSGSSTPNTKPTLNSPTKTLFIGNMSFDMSDRDLNNLFREIKNVIDVRVAIDRRTGQPRGFAHADFVDMQSAERAMGELKGKMVCGRALRVDYSTSTGRAALGEGRNAAPPTM